jgi:hypothetical protein
MRKMEISDGYFCGFSECKYCDPENRDTEPGVCKTMQCEKCGNLYDMEEFDKGLCNECDNYVSYGELKRFYELGLYSMDQILGVFYLTYTLKDEYIEKRTDLFASCTGWNCKCQSPFGFGEGRNNICKLYGFEASEISEKEINKYYRFKHVSEMILPSLD